MRSLLIVASLGLVASLIVAGGAEGKPSSSLIEPLPKINYVLDMLTWVAEGKVSSAHLTFRELFEAYVQVRDRSTKWIGDSVVNFAAYNVLDRVAFVPLANREITEESSDDEKRAFVAKVEDEFVKLYLEERSKY